MDDLFTGDSGEHKDEQISCAAVRIATHFFHEEECMGHSSAYVAIILRAAGSQTQAAFAG
jgi:hypothetical protein